MCQWKGVMSDIYSSLLSLKWIVKNLNVTENDEIYEYL